MPQKYTSVPFKEAFADLLREKQGNPMRTNLKEFCENVQGWSYEALRQMIEGERTLQPAAIEAMSEALGVDPHYFIEYRRAWIARKMLESPEIIQRLYDVARLYEEMDTPSPTVPSAPDAPPPTPDGA
jgi:hypothetical protein